MDLRFSAADEAFRSEFRAWLAEHLPAGWRDPGYWSALDPDEGFAKRRQWEADKARAGWAGIHWPVEFGGRGGTPAQKAIYDEEMALANAPLTVNALGLTFLAPTVMAIGTPEQKRDIIGPLLRNEVIWCQGFSEPGAGSDLAAVRTRGDVDGDEFVVNGQKVWTSNALHADKMFALVRTGTGERKHHGLSMLLVDLRAPGVTVRPLKQLSGANDFGEVFLDDVRVPRTEVLGAEGRGWDVAMLLLSFERGSSAIGQYAAYKLELAGIVDLARRTERNGRPVSQDPVIRQRVADLTVKLETLRLHSLHVLTEVEQGKPLGATSSLTKLHWSRTHQELGELYTDVAGAGHGLLGRAVPASVNALQRSWLWSRSETIWGGSSEIQRNIVSEHLLGLPR